MYRDRGHTKTSGRYGSEAGANEGVCTTAAGIGIKDDIRCNTAVIQSILWYRKLTELHAQSTVWYKTRAAKKLY